MPRLLFPIETRLKLITEGFIVLYFLFCFPTSISFLSWSGWLYLNIADFQNMSDAHDPKEYWARRGRGRGTVSVSRRVKVLILCKSGVLLPMLSGCNAIRCCTLRLRRLALTAKRTSFTACDVRRFPCLIISAWGLWCQRGNENTGADNGPWKSMNEACKLCYTGIA